MDEWKEISQNSLKSYFLEMYDKMVYEKVSFSTMEHGFVACCNMYSCDQLQLCRCPHQIILWRVFARLFISLHPNYPQLSSSLK